MISLNLIGLAILAIIIFHRLYKTIYLLYFSPIRSFPGPKLRAISRLPYQISLVRGYPHRDLLVLHQRYGPVVRIAPNELAFFTAQSFRDIYDKFEARSFKKTPLHYQPPANGVDHLVTVGDEATHGRYRKTFAPGFTTQALREQEHLVSHYANWLMRRLEENAVSGPVAITDWFNSTLFDITGELVFGVSFGCLEQSRIHPWISLMFNSIKAFVFLNGAKQYPTINWLLKMAIPKSLLQKELEHFQPSATKADQRLEMGSERADLLSPIIRNGFSETQGPHLTEKKILSRAEIHSNVYIIIMAGSDTTATVLSGMTYYLCANPKVMQRLVDEIHGSFSTSADITFSSTAELRYLKAVIDEVLRVYPPIAHGLSRVAPQNRDLVDGYFVPEGTTVATHSYAASHSPANFYLPDEFHPERWLGTDPRFANDKLDTVQRFGMGSRVCMGKNLAYAEIRLIVSKLLFQFDMKLHPESENWIDQEVFNVWNKKRLMIKLRGRDVM